MSFGVGVTDILTVSSLAWGVYKSCKESSDDFKRVSTEVASLHVILKETEEFLREDNGLNETRRSRLAMLIESSTDVLNDLKRQLSSYERLGTHSQRTWDRLRWGLEDIADIRSRLISVNTTLAAFNSSLTNSSQARIERKLEKFIAEVRAGLREGSVVSSHEPQTLDDADAWNDLQRELEDIGLSAGMVSEHQEYIKAWFKEVISSGILHQGKDTKYPSATDDDGPGSDFAVARRSRVPHSSSATAVSTAMASISSGSSIPLSAQTTLVDGRPSDRPNGLPPMPGPIRSRTLPQDIDALLSHDTPPFPNLPPPTRSDTAASHSPAMLLRKYSLPSLLVFRLLQKDAKLIEAASDGSLERVATLLSRGANVNVRDKWGWTALSMAAYGGHEAIAKLLLACGAEIEIEDVDGDSPLDLATNRGHTAVVIAIEEERVSRVVRGTPSEPVQRGVGKRTPSTRAGTDAAGTSPLGTSAPMRWKGSSTASVSTTEISPLSRSISQRISPAAAVDDPPPITPFLARPHPDAAAKVDADTKSDPSPITPFLARPQPGPAAKAEADTKADAGILTMPNPLFRTRTETGGAGDKPHLSSRKSSKPEFGPLKKQPTFKSRGLVSS